MTAAPGRGGGSSCQPRRGVLGVSWRVGIVAGCDGVGVADASVAAVDPYFAAARVVDDLSSAINGRLLGIGVGGRSAAARFLHVPPAGWVLHDVTLHEHRLQALFRVTYALKERYGSAVAAAFLRGSNPMLGNKAPMTILANDSPADAEEAIIAAVEALFAS